MSDKVAPTFVHEVHVFSFFLSIPHHLYFLHMEIFCPLDGQSFVYVAQFRINRSRVYATSWIRVPMNPESAMKVVIGEIMTQLWAYVESIAVSGESVTYALPTPPRDRRMISMRWGFSTCSRTSFDRVAAALFSVYFPAPGDKSVEKRNTPRIKFHS